MGGRGSRSERFFQLDIMAPGGAGGGGVRRGKRIRQTLLLFFSLCMFSKFNQGNLKIIMKQNYADFLTRFFRSNRIVSVFLSPINHKELYQG